MTVRGCLTRGGCAYSYTGPEFPPQKETRIYYNVFAEIIIHYSMIIIHNILVNLKFLFLCMGLHAIGSV